MSDTHADDVLLRWHAEITYRTNGGGTIKFTSDLEEIEDLHDLIECGPHWDAIEKIEIHRINQCTNENMTIEEALEYARKRRLLAKRAGRWLH